MPKTKFVTVDLPRAAHSRIGASSAHRWFTCAGSVKMSAGRTGGDSPEAQEGTAAHILAAGCLNRGQDAWEWTGQKITVLREDGRPPDEFVVDQAMAEDVQVYLDAVRQDLATDIAKGQGTPRIFVEEKFTLSEIDEDAYGTTDCALLCCGEDLMRVYDLKYGEGIVVEVEENEQAMYYAVGIIEWMTNKRYTIPSTVELVIAQPRIDHPDGFVRRWRISVDSLGEWAFTTLKKKIAATRAKAPALVVGEHCRFCPGKPVCPAIRGVFDELANGHPAAVNELEDWELAERMERIPAARKFIGYLEDETFIRRSKGQDVPGWKIVHKKANRVWAEGSEEAVVAVIGEDAAYTRKFRSPSQVEKLGKTGKKLAAEYAYKPETGLTLAPESDRREAVAPRTVEEVFGDIT